MRLPQPDQESWRVFCAIELPENVRERVIRHVKTLRESVPETRASWSRRENIHLTLKFLAHVPIPLVNNLSLAAARAVEGHSPFEITIEETGAFPKRGSPRVLWIGVKDESGALSALNSRLENESFKESFPSEERAFHPHLTIARLRGPEGARDLASAHKELHFESTLVTVSELLVIRSELSSDGSKYSVISRHPMAPRKLEP